MCTLQKQKSTTMAPAIKTLKLLRHLKATWKRHKRNAQRRYESSFYRGTVTIWHTVIINFRVYISESGLESFDSYYLSRDFCLLSFSFDHRQFLSCPRQFFVSSYVLFWISSFFNSFFFLNCFLLDSAFDGYGGGSGGGRYCGCSSGGHNHPILLCR